MEPALASLAFLGGFLELSTVFNDTDVVLVDVRVSAFFTALEIVSLASDDSTPFLVLRVLGERIVA